MRARALACGVLVSVASGVSAGSACASVWHVAGLVNCLMFEEFLVYCLLSASGFLLKKTMTRQIGECSTLESDSARWRMLYLIE